MRTLTIGSQGDDVRDVQLRLIEAGFEPGPADGIFGPTTQFAVFAFQRSRDLVDDGWVGPITHERLTRAADLPVPDYIMERGSSGFAVKEWQAWLNIHGHRAGAADGEYGRKTAAGTRRFQRAAGLLVTGKVQELDYSVFESWMNNKESSYYPPSLQRGDRGPDVRTLQGNLKLEGFDAGPVDGIYGGKTQGAVLVWQQSKFLPIGVFLAAQWPDLFERQIQNFVDHLVKQDTPYLSERTLSLAHVVVPWFHGDGNPGQALKDRYHALHIMQGESGGHVLMNDIRWGHLSRGRPIGLFAVMTHLRWPQRLGFEETDMHHAGQNARVAGALVYSRKNSWLGFHHWWSVGRHVNPAIEALGLGIRVVWYCPQDPSYWKNVPAGSNFICNGVNYG